MILFVCYVFVSGLFLSLSFRWLQPVGERTGSFVTVLSVLDLPSVLWPTGHFIFIIDILTVSMKINGWGPLANIKGQLSGNCKCKYF